MDTNFRIDKNSEPIPVHKDSFRHIDRAFHNDCKFLSNNNVIDYSVLFIIDNKNNLIKMGIIDYLRKFTIDKQFESTYKLIKNLG